jgi:hypothetical protein
MWPLLSTVIGLWLMAAPAILGYGGTAADADHIAGPLVVSFAVISMWEVTRSVLRLNLLVAPWLLAAPWLLGYELTPAINSLLAGLALIPLALLGNGVDAARYGGGWRGLWGNGQ